MLRLIPPSKLRAASPQPIDAQTLAIARRIIDDIERRGWPAALAHARKFGDLPRGAKPIHTKADLRRALDAIGRDERRVLESAARDIGRFARNQRASLQSTSISHNGLRMGHRVIPLDSAGCYAPGGRFPLPSSVLMTCVTARAARVPTVWCASPRPAPVTLAAAAIAGADALLAIGGAQAIATMALGAGPVPACAIVVGPGNRFVTAAKQLLAHRVGIDMLAGPSEVLVIADGSTDARLMAADLLAQAEHDPDARAILITTSRALVARVNAELREQLNDLPTAPIARQALAHSFVVLARDLDHACALSDRLAPEHLEIMTENPVIAARKCTRYGAIFIGQRACEVLGDYGVGPNHVLPTAGSARFSTGLSALTFLRARTFIEATGKVPSRIYSRAASFARLENLEAHARAAEARIARANRKPSSTPRANEAISRNDRPQMVRAKRSSLR